MVKPLASAATDNVAICADATQVREAAETILGTETIWGEVTREVLIQSYLDSVEYVVDMVSWQGRRNTPTEQSGTVRGVNQDVVAEIEALPSVRELVVKLRPGWRMRPTVDLLSSTLKAFLAAESTEELQRDYQRITELKDGVYQLE